MHAIHRLRENLPPDAGTWLETFDHDLAAAWRACARPDWLLRMCLAVDLGRGLVVHAAVDVASLALSAHPVADVRPRRALAVARRWMEGRATGSEAWAAGFGTMDVAERLEGRAAEAVRAAAFVAFACDEKADGAFYAHRAYAPRAAAHAAHALADPERAASQVRARVPLSSFLTAFDLASRPPPPMPSVEPSRPISDSFYA